MFGFCSVLFLVINGLKLFFFILTNRNKRDATDENAASAVLQAFGS